METQKFQIQKVQIENGMVVKIILGGMLSPEELPKLVEAVKSAAAGASGAIVLSGRLPVWGFAALAAALAASGAEIVAAADPKLAGGVIVHGGEVGRVIPLPAEAF